MKILEQPYAFGRVCRRSAAVGAGADGSRTGTAVFCCQIVLRYARRRCRLGFRFYAYYPNYEASSKITTCVPCAKMPGYAIRNAAQKTVENKKSAVLLRRSKKSGRIPFRIRPLLLLTVFILQVGKNPLLRNLQCCMRKSLDRNCRDLSPKAAPRRHPKGRPW